MRLLPCSGMEGNEEEHLLLGPEKKKSTALCSEKRHWLPVGDEPVSQSSSPYICECWHFQCDESFCLFLALSGCFTSADYCFYLACRGEWASHCSVVNYNRLISISKKFTMCLSAYLHICMAQSTKRLINKVSKTSNNQSIDYSLLCACILQFINGFIKLFWSVILSCNSTMKNTIGRCLFKVSFIE